MVRSAFNVILRRHFSETCIKRKENNYYITTPIFYVNASPHIGHLYTVVIADATNRFQKLLGCNTYFATGTDEHGTKIQQAAEAHKMPLPEYCNKISERYRDLFKKCEIEHTDFVRTTDPRHFKAVHSFWECIRSRGFIYKGKYSGWYCVQDEAFLTDAQLVDGPDNKKFSADSGHPAEWTEEDTFKFRLSDLTNDVYYWLKDANVTPEKFKRRIFGWLADESVMSDLSISRPTSRVHWGIPVPGHPEQTIYVWLDALVNYLTVAGYPDAAFAKTWPPDLQIVGKDILKFHGIYWPAFLIAAGLDPPSGLLCHSHWTVDGEKMSKSKGNVVDPFDRVEKYTTSGLRYFLLREGAPHMDGNYSDEKVIRVLNSELADTLGNLLSRCCGTAINPKQCFPPFSASYKDLGTEESAALIAALESLPSECRKHFEECYFYRGIHLISATLRAANKFFATEKPWQLVKNNSERLDPVLYLTMESLRVCGILLQPIVPTLSKILLDHLGVPSSKRSWADSVPFSDPSGSSVSDQKLILYSKLVSSKEAVQSKA